MTVTWSSPVTRSYGSPPRLDAPTAAALVADLRTALAGRVVVCVTHDGDVEQPGDTVVRLTAAPAWV